MSVSGRARLARNRQNHSWRRCPLRHHQESQAHYPQAAVRVKALPDYRQDGAAGNDSRRREVRPG